MFNYKPKSIDKIIVREFSFEFPDKLDPIWIPGERVRSHMFNGLSLTMPYLEPFLVKTGREAAAYVDSEELREDIRAFCGQESQHYKCHRRLNQVLAANGYLEFKQVEADMEQIREKLESVEAAMAGQARNLLLWHTTNRFCGSCGGATLMRRAGWQVGSRE